MQERTAQAVAVFVLTGLAVAAAVAGPWYVEAAARHAAAVDVASAPAAQRVLSVRQNASTRGEPAAALAGFRAAVRRSLTVPEREPGVGMTAELYSGGFTGSGQLTAVRRVPVAYREDVCAHVTVVGKCPGARDETLVSAAAAAELGVAIGDELPLRLDNDSNPVVLRIVGRYETADPNGFYWADPLFGPARNVVRPDQSGDQQQDIPAVDPVFVGIDTFAVTALGEPTLVYNTVVPDQLLRGDDGYDLDAELRRTDFRFSGTGLHLVNQTQDLLTLIERDRATVRDGTLVATIQVLLLSWFALGIAARYGAAARRQDVALLKLRGSTGLGALRPLGRQAVPVLLGALVGAPLGYLGALVMAGRVTESGAVRSAVGLSAAALGATLAGVVVALVVTEFTALRAPVATLLRRLPPVRRRWRADLIDLGLLVVAAAGLYQARFGGAGVLADLGPTLVAVALAILLARLLGWVGGRAASAALDAGHVRPAMAAMNLVRRPGTDRLLALLLVVVAVFTAGDAWYIGHAARSARADISLGAPRVLTVRAANRTSLLAAVRAADPAGRTAMAAVVNTAGPVPVLAVDLPRLAAVAHWRADYGPLPPLSAALTPPAELTAGAIQVTGSDLTLRARNTSTVPVNVVAQLGNQETGAAVSVHFATLRPAQEQELTARLDGCARGCRLVGLTLTGDDGAVPPSGASVTVTGLAQRGPDRTVLDADRLGDVRRWRGAVSGVALAVTPKDGALTLTMSEPPAAGGNPEDQVDGRQRTTGLPQDAAVFVVDAPAPLPLVLAGPLPAAWAATEPTFSLFGGGPVPVRVAATAPVLPVVGRAGALVDLGSAQRAVAESGGSGTFQVWLTADAAPGLLDKLRDSGLTILADDDPGEVSGRLGSHGPASAARFQLFVVMIGLLLGGATLTVAAAAERRPQTVDLRNLRAQGLSGPQARWIGLAGPALLVAIGLSGGLFVGVLAQWLAGAPPTVFPDDWAVVAPPTAPRPEWLLATAAAGLLVLGAGCWLAVAPLARAVRNGGRA